MKKVISGHMVSYSKWKEWEEYENYIYFDEVQTERYDGYADTPCLKECDEICSKLSGEVITYKINIHEINKK